MKYADSGQIISKSKMREIEKTPKAENKNSSSHTLLQSINQKESLKTQEICRVQRFFLVFTVKGGILPSN